MCAYGKLINDQETKWWKTQKVTAFLSAITALSLSCRILLFKTISKQYCNIFQLLFAVWDSDMLAFTLQRLCIPNDHHRPSEHNARHIGWHSHMYTCSLITQDQVNRLWSWAIKFILLNFLFLAWNISPAVHIEWNIKIFMTLNCIWQNNQIIWYILNYFSVIRGGSWEIRVWWASPFPCPLTSRLEEFWYTAFQRMGVSFFVSVWVCV